MLTSTLCKYGFSLSSKISGRTLPSAPRPSIFFTSWEALSAWGQSRTLHTFKPIGHLLGTNTYIHQSALDINITLDTFPGLFPGTKFRLNWLWSQYQIFSSNPFNCEIKRMTTWTASGHASHSTIAAPRYLVQVPYLYAANNIYMELSHLYGANTIFIWSYHHIYMEIPHLLDGWCSQCVTFTSHFVSKNALNIF